jgi:hypothetical protein
LVAVIGTLVLFAELGRRFIFISEQFWGRAARASGDSQESGRPLIFEAIFQCAQPNANRIQISRRKSNIA